MTGVRRSATGMKKTLRIISAIQPIVKLNTAASSTGAVRFSKEIRSWTGFEYPSIADIDGDGSADMIVMGSYRGSDTQGYIFAVQADPLQTSFAPAPKVWNQFMYHPLKINEDLTTPLINLHPLKMQYVLEKMQVHRQRRLFIMQILCRQLFQQSLTES